MTSTMDALAAMIRDGGDLQDAIDVWNFVIDDLVAEADRECEKARIAAFTNPSRFANATAYSAWLQLRSWIYARRMGETDDDEPGDIPLRPIETATDISTVGEATDG